MNIHALEMICIYFIFIFIFIFIIGRFLQKSDYIVFTSVGFFFFLGGFFVLFFFLFVCLHQMLSGLRLLNQPSQLNALNTTALEGTSDGTDQKWHI